MKLRIEIPQIMGIIIGMIVVKVFAPILFIISVVLVMMINYIIDINKVDKKDKCKKDKYKKL